MMKTRRRFLNALILVGSVVLIAATWYGTFDVSFNPRDRGNDEDARAFIRDTVNASPTVVMWKASDSVTLCQSGTSNCAIYVYMPNGTWAFGRAIDSRSRPPESWLEKLIRWLLGEGTDPGSVYDTVAGEADYIWTDCFGVGGGVRVTYYVEGYWRHGYVNGQYAGSVFIGTNVYQYETVGPSGCA